ncbi:tripartite tricarboxylate transporter TctB family protein [Consotaella salsifontis]|uniref:Putative tricarboxylic transport membrane protein n=1 Tax=Consotaella salsifontis TaxID=1365950 RepID=A0A1T4MGM3_9HYPH|nr:tripartite tricarboxylate transporter TctB family protein [Consotaella salsifontis]SJZ66063.1 putative tricarboxylic transport membrane protein [Consotaella salsifontis]
MKIHDAIIGAIFLCIGIAVVIYARTLVPPRHLAYGPGFFPFLVGCGLALVGGGIVIQSWRGLRATPFLVAPDWLASRKAFLRFWVLPFSIAFYMLAIGPFGFLGTATVLLAMILVVNDVSPLPAIGISLAVAMVVNIIFASFLHVPLSWGLLTPISGWFIW